MKRTGRDCITGEIITVYAEEKDMYGKSIWRTTDGKAYEISGARHLGRQTWIFAREPHNDRT